VSPETPSAGSPASPSLSAPAHEPPRDSKQDLTKHINGVRERLSKEFQPKVAADVISREVDLAAAAFDGARVTTYVPVLVNRQVRLKLRQLVSA
jgi:hypothetical protein